MPCKISPRLSFTLLKRSADVGAELIDSLGVVDCHFAYDDLNQLISENANSYSYDSLYNRLSKNSLHHQVNDLCQMTHDGQTHYQYDLNGNLIRYGEIELAYDSLDRLVKVTKGNQTYEYAYDSLNRRLTKKTPTETIHYFWDDKNEIGSTQGELRVLGEGFGAEIGAAVFIQLKGKTYIPLHDQRGALVTLLDTKGNPIETHRYTAFGEELTIANISPWRFSSKRLDSESGLLYFGRRYYLPSLGRFITTDPQGFKDGPNLYAYAHNSPYLEIDLYGEFGELLDWRRYGKDTLEFVFPCGMALYNLPANAPLWKRGALAFGTVGEAALTFFPPLKVGASIAEKTFFQIGKAVLSRESERRLMRTAGKAASIAAERKIVQTGTEKVALNRFHQAASELSEAGQNNIRILRNWAKSKGWDKLPNQAGKPETWGQRINGEFEWRLRIKPEASFRAGLDKGSNIPRFDARLGSSVQNEYFYLNPFSGETGGRAIGTHLPLDYGYF